MAVEADKLKVTLTSAGGGAVSRAINRVGGAARDTADDVSEMGSNLASTGRDALSLSGKSQLLKGRLDAVSDEMEQVSGRASGASMSMSAFAGSTGVAAGASAGLSTVTALSLVPAIAALVTTIAPLAAILGTVAAAATGLGLAFGTVIGAGVLADFEGFKNQLKGLKTELKAIIVPFGSQFVPLIQDAIDAIPTLAQNIIDSIGSLTEFKNELRRLGGVAMDVIPDIVGGLFDLARVALPAFRDLISFVRQNATPVIGSFRDATDRLGPSLLDLTDSLIGLLPSMHEFGMVVLEVVLPPLTSLMNIAGEAADSFSSLDSEAQKLVATAAILAPALIPLSKVATTLSGAFSSVAGALATFGSGITSVAAVIGGAISSIALLGTNVGALLAPLSSAATYLSGIGATIVSTVPLLSTLSTALSGVGASISAALPTLAGISAALTGIGAAIVGAMPFLGSLTSAISSLLAPLSGVVASIGGIGSTIAVAAPSLGTLGAAVVALTGPFAMAAVATAGLIGAIGSLSLAAKTDMATIKRVFRNVLKKAKQHLSTLAGAVRTIANGKFKKGFQQLGTVVRDVMKDVRVFLVGKDGSGGLLSQIISEGVSFLKNDANSMLFSAADSAFKTLKDAMSNAKTAIIGKGGSGGLIDQMIGGITSYLKSDAAKQLAKAAGKAFGKGIRAVSIDVYNAIIGKEPSVIGDMIGAIVSYLKNDAWSDLKEASKVLWGVIKSAAEGLYDGLIGNSLFPEMIGDIVSYLENDAWSDLKSAGKGLMDSMINGVESKIGALKDAVENAAQAVRDRLPGSDAKTGPLSDLTKAGEALPETFSHGIETNLRTLNQASDGMAGTAHPMANSSTTQTSKSEHVVVNVNVDARGASDPDAVATSISDELRSVINR